MAQVALDLLDHPSSSTPSTRSRTAPGSSCPLLRHDPVERRIAGREANAEVPGALKESPDFCGHFGACVVCFCFVWFSWVLKDESPWLGGS